MAQISPFPAYRYDLGKVRADDVVTQPYDKITPDMQRRYLERSPYNLVRLILGPTAEGDSPADNQYTRAGAWLREWIMHGIVRRDPEPAVYPYTQTFTVPDSGEKLTRRGFIALGRLEPYDANVIFRHEQTLSGPKQDRLELLRATHTHFGQIFMLYSDPSQATERELLERAVNPILQATDEYGTVHRLFRESDTAVIVRLQKQMQRQQLIIADGHHRYETALAWAEEQRRRRRGAEAHGETQPFDWVMMTFVNLDAPGLVVLPTHRVLHSLQSFDAATARARLDETFAIEELGFPATPEAWPELRAALAAGAIAAVFAGAPHPLLLRLRGTFALERELPDILPAQRQLDVVRLHELALGRALGVSAEAVREQRHLRYVRDGREALLAVAAGAQAAFFLNPISPGQVRDVALAGGVMPQKSTDFYPKLLSGLTMYRVQ
jgi:uncharacterized protein (DUF1015 family)